MRVIICKSFVDPEYILIGSKSEDPLVHKVIPPTIFNDPLCDCKGYYWRGYCSHIDQVRETHCTGWHTMDLSYTGLCPVCNAGVIEFELDPEWRH